MAKQAHIKLCDGINVLPDEILVCILSFLTVKEAAATSILGRRWRYLWTFINNLDFDGSDFYWRVGSRLKHFGNFGREFLREVRSILRNLEESWNYIACVNDVLGLHRGCSIEEFRVDFLLYEAHKEYIDRWLSFASAKKVKRLELNLRWTPYLLGDYIFPCELFINFKHLRTMRLQWVSVTGEGVELLLGSSPLLEELSVSLSNTLGALKITGASLALKRLEICGCYITSIEIRDVNLEFFMYDGGVLQMIVLKNVPVVEMHLGGSVLSLMKDLLIMFSSYLPQLEKLTIDGTHMRFSNLEDAKMFYNNVKMSNLHQLKFKTHMTKPAYMVPVTYFIRASPLLQNFVLEVHGSKKEENLYFVKRLSTNEKLVAYKYPHLKRVEMIGYRGTSSELALALHLLKNGTALEQFNVDLRKRDDPQFIRNYFWPNSVKGGLPVGYPYQEEDEINALKARVKQQLIKGVPLPLQQHLQVNIL